MVHEDSNINYGSVLDRVLDKGYPYKNSLLDYGRKIGLGPEAAEEALADAIFIATKQSNLINKMDRELGAGILSVEDASRALTYYLRKTIRTRLIDGVRKEKRRHSVEVSAHQRRVDRDQVRDTRDLINMAIESLPDDDRFLLRLVHFEDMPMAQIAQRLRVSSATAYRRTKIAEHKLLDAIEKLMDPSR